jgi:hypothetical protein
MLEILHLAKQCPSSYTSLTKTALPPRLRNSQRRLREELTVWLAAYNSTLTDDHERFPPVEAVYMGVLCGYHTMATIMVNTCAWQMYETVYDFYTDDFLLLLKRLIGVWKMLAARPVWHQIPNITDNLRSKSHSVCDKGWIPLLYFVAVKCRVHRIRLQAIKLLAQTSHKEGIWDSDLIGVMTQEIMRIEEGDYYQSFEKDDNFSIVSTPTERDISLPPLPGDRRLYNIQIGLPEHPMGVLTLEFDRRRGEGNGTETSKTWYDLRTQKWANAMVDTIA